MLADAGSKVYAADGTMSVNVDPLVEPCTLSVWVRAPQPEVGVLSTTRFTLTDAARSTCRCCGKALFTLSQ